MSKVYIYNDWTAEYIGVNDRKSAVKVADHLINDWKKEMKSDDYEEEGNFRGTGYAKKMVGCCDWKWMITVEIIKTPDFSNVKKEKIIHLDDVEVFALTKND